MHPEHDGSLHLTLPSALYNEVLRAGWGEPHPISATMMVFGPRDEVELDVVWQLVCAPHSWATATKDDETPLRGLPTKNPSLPLGAAAPEGSGMRWRGERRLPPAAATLGLELIAADVEKGTIEVALAATEAFTTPMGDILGGFLAAMLYNSNIHTLPVPAQSSPVPSSHKPKTKADLPGIPLTRSPARRPRGSLMRALLAFSPPLPPARCLSPCGCSAA